MGPGDWIALGAIAVTILGGLIHILLKAAKVDAKVEALSERTQALSDRVQRNEDAMVLRETKRDGDDDKFRQFCRDRFDALTQTLTNLLIEMRTMASRYTNSTHKDEG